MPLPITIHQSQVRPAVGSGRSSYFSSRTALAAEGMAARNLEDLGKQITGIAMDRVEKQAKFQTATAMADYEMASNKWTDEFLSNENMGERVKGGKDAFASGDREYEEFLKSASNQISKGLLPQAKEAFRLFRTQHDVKSRAKFADTLTARQQAYNQDKAMATILDLTRSGSLDTVNTYIAANSDLWAPEQMDTVFDIARSETLYNLMSTGMEEAEQAEAMAKEVEWSTPGLERQVVSAAQSMQKQAKAAEKKQKKEDIENRNLVSMDAIDKEELTAVDIMAMFPREEDEGDEKTVQAMRDTLNKRVEGQALPDPETRWDQYHSGQGIVLDFWNGDKDRYEAIDALQKLRYEDRVISQQEYNALRQQIEKEYPAQVLESIRSAFKTTHDATKKPALWRTLLGLGQVVPPSTGLQGLASGVARLANKGQAERVQAEEALASRANDAVIAEVDRLLEKGSKISPLDTNLLARQVMVTGLPEEPIDLPGKTQEPKKEEEKAQLEWQAFQAEIANMTEEDFRKKYVVED